MIFCPWLKVLVILLKGLTQNCQSVVEQFDKLTVKPVETTSYYLLDIHFDKLSVQIKIYF